MIKADAKSAVHFLELKIFLLRISLINKMTKLSKRLSIAICNRKKLVFLLFLEESFLFILKNVVKF